ncbi:hypothetical protein [Gracilibacillus boraciitolerans]|nr:hypothetical protein [Gracilibacillus boraciitolerans]
MAKWANQIVLRPPDGSPGVKPRNIGNSFIVGHVDSREGPAVFFI